MCSCRAPAPADGVAAALTWRRWRTEYRMAKRSLSGSCWPSSCSVVGYKGQGWCMRMQLWLCTRMAARAVTLPCSQTTDGPDGRPAKHAKLAPSPLPFLASHLFIAVVLLLLAAMPASPLAVAPTVRGLILWRAVALHSLAYTPLVATSRLLALPFVILLFFALHTGSQAGGSHSEVCSRSTTHAPRQSLLFQHHGLHSGVPRLVPCLHQGSASQVSSVKHIPLPPRPPHCRCPHPPHPRQRVAGLPAHRPRPQGLQSTT